MNSLGEHKRAVEPLIKYDLGAAGPHLESLADLIFSAASPRIGRTFSWGKAKILGGRIRLASASEAVGISCSRALPDSGAGRIRPISVCSLRKNRKVSFQDFLPDF